MRCLAVVLALFLAGCTFYCETPQDVRQWREDVTERINELETDVYGPYQPPPTPEAPQLGFDWRAGDL